MTPRSVIEKFAAVQMLDVHIPTADGRELILTCYTQPEPDLTLPLQNSRSICPTAGQDHAREVTSATPV